MVERRFRFGVSVATTPDAATWRDRARRYEAQGFDILLAADHLDGPMSPFSALVAAATVTERLRIGTFVVNNDFWNPLILAREAATADLLSDGRFELGLGAGHAQQEYEEAGLTYDRPAIRVARLTETVPLLRRLLDGDKVSHDGDHVHLAEASTGLARAGSRIPLLVGGNGDRVLATGAVHADTVGLVGFTSGSGRSHSDLSHFTWAGLEERIAHVRRAAGPRAGEVELNVLVQFVRSGDRRAIADELAQEIERPADFLLDSPFLMLGGVDDNLAHVARLRSLGVTYLVAFAERGAEELAPVIERVT